MIIISRRKTYICVAYNELYLKNITVTIIRYTVSVSRYQNVDNIIIFIRYMLMTITYCILICVINCILVVFFLIKTKYIVFLYIHCIFVFGCVYIYILHI